MDTTSGKENLVEKSASARKSEQRLRQKSGSIPDTIRLIIESPTALIHTLLCPTVTIDYFKQPGYGCGCRQYTTLELNFWVHPYAN